MVYNIAFGILLFHILLHFICDGFLTAHYYKYLENKIKMIINLSRIAAYLKSENIIFETYGDDIEVQKLQAFLPPIERALCYLVGSAPPDVSTIKNSIIICEPGTKVVFPESNSIIYTENPQLSFYLASSLFEQKKDVFIHPQALVTTGTQIGSNVSVGPFSVLEDCTIGDNVTIDAGVKIYKGTIIGSNVKIQSNTVIGANGVMWAWGSHGNKVLCAQTGNTIIQDDAVLGSNITIVRGAFENTPTIIGFETMISHGTMIGHGVVIGDRCHLANNVSLAGSVKVENNCFLGSGVVVRPHITIPQDSIVGAGAVVVKNYSANGVVLAGNPAREMDKNKLAFSGVPTPHSKSK